MTDKVINFSTIELLEKLHPKAKEAYERLLTSFPEDAPIFVPMTVAALVINSVLGKVIREEDANKLKGSAMVKLKTELENYLSAAYLTLQKRTESDE